MLNLTKVQNITVLTREISPACAVASTALSTVGYSNQAIPPQPLLPSHALPLSRLRPHPCRSYDVRCS